MMLLWEGTPTKIDFEPGVFLYEATLYDYNMTLKAIIKDPVTPIRAILTTDGQFYFFSLVDGNNRNQAQFCRRV